MKWKSWVSGEWEAQAWGLLWEKQPLRQEVLETAVSVTCFYGSPTQKSEGVRTELHFLCEFESRER